MVRAVHIHAPRAIADQICNILQDDIRCTGLCKLPCESGKSVMVYFKCAAKHTSTVLRSIEKTGIGSSFGSIDIYALQSTIPEIRSGDGIRKYKLSDRQTIREIEKRISDNNHLTFDYIVMTIIAAVIAGMGLLSGSAVTLVASMLVSPLMGPILSVSYGLAVRNRLLVTKGLRNEFWGIIICIVIGVVFGLISTYAYNPENPDDANAFDTKEMYERGRKSGLTGSLVIAVFSGMGVAIAVTNESTNALVGVAISAALLPPLVNAFLCMTLGGMLRYYNMYDEQVPYLEWGIISLCLYLVNFSAIILTSYTMFRIKGVKSRNREFPGESREIMVVPNVAPEEVDLDFH